MQVMGIWINRDFVLIAAGVAVAVWFIYTRWKAQVRLKKLALEMGLTFSTSADDLFGSTREPPMRRAGFSPSIVAGVGGLFGRWRMAGEVNGVTVDVHQVVTRIQDKPSKSTYLEAFFGKPKCFGMLIMRRREPTFRDKIVSSTIADKIVSMLSEDTRTEIKTGNEMLDQKVLIKAKDVQAIRSFVGDAGVQDQIMRAIVSDAGVSVDDEGATVIRSGRFSDPDQIRSILNVLSETVRRLESAP